MRLFTLALAVALPLRGEADLLARFVEGAPTDRFEFENLRDCAVENAEIAVDLGASQGGLVFDTTATGAGVEVFQPFQIVAGESSLRSLPAVNDGDTSLLLNVSILPAGGMIAFTIDVDDTIGAGPTIVAGAEIAGATAALRMADATFSAPFGVEATARIVLPPCPGV